MKPIEPTAHPPEYWEERVARAKRKQEERATKYLGKLPPEPDPEPPSRGLIVVVAVASATFWALVIGWACWRTIFRD